MPGDPPRDTHRQVVLDVWEVVAVHAETVAFPNDTLAFTGSVSADLRERVAAAFVALLEMEDGRATLEEGYRFEGLEPIDDSAYHPQRELIAAAEGAR